MHFKGPVTFGRTEKRTSPDNATEDPHDLIRKNKKHIHVRISVIQSRQSLTSTDVRFRRLKFIPTL